MSRLKRGYLISLLMGLALFIPASATSVWAESSVGLVPPALDQAIEQYIQSHPEVIEKALKSLEVKRQEEQKLRIKQAIAEHQSELLHDPDSPVSGNPSGDVTVVEFFDYRCGYCKRVAGSVTKLQQEDPGVRVVYKDFPILGDASVFASRAALAARRQGKHQMFHEAMLASERDLSQDEVLSIAEQVGLDRKILEADMHSSTWDSVIDRNRSLAEALSISGTPGFVLGEELYRGALGFEKLKDLVGRARALTSLSDKTSGVKRVN